MQASWVGQSFVPLYCATQSKTSSNFQRPNLTRTRTNLARTLHIIQASPRRRFPCSFGFLYVKAQRNQHCILKSRLRRADSYTTHPVAANKRKNSRPPVHWYCQDCSPSSSFQLWVGEKIEKATVPNPTQPGPSTYIYRPFGTKPSGFLLFAGAGTRADWSTNQVKVLSVIHMRNEKQATRLCLKKIKNKSCYPGEGGRGPVTGRVLQLSLSWERFTLTVL